MDRLPCPVFPNDLYSRIGTAAAPVILDVRAQDVFDADDRMIVGAIRPRAERLPQWLSDLPKGRGMIVYCHDGGANSQCVEVALRRSGIPAAWLDGGIALWQRQKLPTRRKTSAATDKWVTREHPKIDRIACPWLVSRFIDPDAQFLYVPQADVAAVARTHGATPYDIKDVEFGHVGDRCSFDAIVRHYDIDDAPLNDLATIVRGADASRPDLAPQCHGLLAISYGLSANFPDDHEMLKHGLVIYDALYAWCRLQRDKARG
jgi:rhodanese-related sulfurtransferase